MAGIFAQREAIFKLRGPFSGCIRVGLEPDVGQHFSQALGRSVGEPPKHVSQIR